ncbi:hypothetical protein SAMN05192560_0781 [Methylobacillus rhizosphaerae]|uniref:Uncharacterized protein n=1 Tax=Methylobacillus rhizosphaerae TaxID=551994 RepID=A0A238YSW9_9PROT|nr:hypothetical protein [Methylobacillus rhizosphaerae]SNR73791.1 hypothetical protein SAMN05192560_0781 [Methylobacillus rhizosphaerae]
MASEVEICNLALARLGDDATIASIDPPEGSMQAEHCQRFYPIARDSMLEVHDWNFSKRRTLLSRLTVNSWNWRFAYAEPANVIRLLAVLPQHAPSDQDSVPFESEGSASGASIILTDLEDATLRYTERVIDTTKFPPLFTDALAWLLASYLAGPIIKGAEGASMAQKCYQSFMLILGQARTSEANQVQKDIRHIPDWMAARGMVECGDFLGRR